MMQERERGKFVCFFGEDTHLSLVQSQVLAISQAYDRAYYEALDIDVPRVDVMPIGLTEFYLRDQDYWHIMERIDRPKPAKSSDDAPRVLAAAGAHWALHNSDRAALKTLCASGSTALALDCRISKHDWWARLHSASHMANPLGNGMQSPKFYEALLMRTIPICTRHLVFRKLYDAGWPLVFVDDFESMRSKPLDRNATSGARARMRLNHAQISSVQGMWRYLRRGGFDSNIRLRKKRWKEIREGSGGRH
jgi:hypothetical protein